MPILNIKIGEVGLTGVIPQVVYINTNDTLAQVTTTGYLNKAVQNGASFSETDMALVSTKTSTSAASTQIAWLEVSKSGDDWSLVPTGSPGEVVLPTVANQLAHATNTTGTLSTDAANVTNAGNITAIGAALIAGTTVAAGTTVTGGTGIIATTGNVTATAGNVVAGSSGTAGTFISFPATAANGTLILSALNAGGAFNTTIRNSTMGQSSVVSIPDPGAATANFLLDTGAANILAKQQFVGLSQVLTFGTGTWTITRIAQGNYVSRHTPGDETSIIAIDVTPAIRIAASKGFRLDSFDVIYAIAANALDAHSVTLDRIAYADNVAVSVTSIAITATLATATQANPYVTNAVVDVPAFDVTADSKYVIEVTVDNAAASEYDFYGIMLRFSETIG